MHSIHLSKGRRLIGSIGDGGDEFPDEQGILFYYRKLLGGDRYVFSPYFRQDWKPMKRRLKYPQTVSFRRIDEDQFV